MAHSLFQKHLLNITASGSVLVLQRLGKQGTVLALRQLRWWDGGISGYYNNAIWTAHDGELCLGVQRTHPWAELTGWVGLGHSVSGGVGSSRHGSFEEVFRAGKREEARALVLEGPICFNELYPAGDGNPLHSGLIVSANGVRGVIWGD